MPRPPDEEGRPPGQVRAPLDSQESLAKETHRDGTTADSLATAAAELLHLVGRHADESIAQLDHLERAYRDRLDALPDAPELAELHQDIALVRRVADDVGWMRTVAAQALFEIGVEREVRKAMEQRLARLEWAAKQTTRHDRAGAA
jgi:hypothetical protein